MGVILGFILAAIFIFTALLAVYGVKEDKGRVIVIASSLTLFFFVLFLIVPFGFKEVKTGEVALVKVWGEAKEVRTAGIFWRFWVSDKVQIYDTKTQQIDMQTPAYSKDAQTMDIAMTVQFKLQSDKIKEINAEFGELEIITERIRSLAEENVKVILSGQSAMEIIENRSTLSTNVYTLVASNGSNYYVDITAVLINNIDFSDAFETVVENKMVAEQEQLKAEFEKDKAIIKAEELLEVSRRKAQEDIVKAEGEAQARIEIATAEAEAIRLKSLEVARMLGFEIEEDVIIMEGKTPEEIKLISDYLKYIEYIETWDGVLPEVIAGEGVELILPPLS